MAGTNTDNRSAEDVKKTVCDMIDQLLGSGAATSTSDSSEPSGVENTKEDGKKEDEPATTTDGKNAEGGAVVAIDPKTGQILVCASNPTFDLSTYFEDYDKLLEMANSPLYNRALQAIYAPGSTYKMSTLIAGFEAQVYTADSIIVDLRRTVSSSPSLSRRVCARLSDC